MGSPKKKKGQQRYEWKEGAQRNRVAREHDPQVVGLHIEKLRQERGGYLKPEDLLADATTKDSPIHTCFTWNERQAAYQHRLNEARWLLRNLTVTRVFVNHKVIETAPQRPFVRVVDRNEDLFTSIDDAMSKESERRQLVERALAELKGWRRRYGTLKELAKICKFLDSQLD